MGMIKERIRTQEQNQRHRALVEENRRLKLKKFQEKEHQRMVRKSFHVLKCFNSKIVSLFFIFREISVMMKTFVHVVNRWAQQHQQFFQWKK